MHALQQSLALGPVGISIGQLLIVLAFFMALLAGALLGRRYRTPVADTLFTLLLLGLAGARTLFVIRYWGSYDGILSILDIRDGGFDPLGGLVVGLAYALWLMWRHPAQRVALAGALTTGAITWGLLAGPLLLMESTARPLPDTALVALDGSPADLPSLAAAEGQPLVVNLWATWCPPCIREMPVFEQMQQEADDITFVFVNQGEDARHVERFLAEHTLELDNILLDARNSLGEVTGSMAMPTTLFYDADGQLRSTHFGELSRATLLSGIERLR
ncbi:TlpA family protein disulfide reductase [Billgrantia kenyensis]|uniref:TlpA family protein disulfide reductase n=1 Tax=Billgrantia kenyensis TaxID=321266 RepID=A0A7W0ADB8_9GAMM|nr:TlpA disulfide reductase family protein [Halomonas kenyensis]MBA2778449.1 TlpA family protein disulfide reductase [Halomonas kenyensis]MCG6660755.1 TlpA family protein disulfide reductase [Halomonas kenyensis]